MRSQKENQLIRYTQWLEFHPDRIADKPGHSTVMQYSFVLRLHTGTILLNSNTRGCSLIYNNGFITQPTFFKIVWRAEYPNTIESQELQNYNSVHYG